ncbi:hypothetical protein [uncultured Zoogloea sp.]|uniref:head-tail connector protein n=1 Tax=uncultured Zoogloea sp. TaxID=160237 RepID=UPI0026107800|nr:hypothetical protein [uncultured Zoogloea sp.]
MPTPILVTSPATSPLSLAEAKQYCNVALSHDDQLIEDLILGAVSRLDGWGGLLGRALEAQTWELMMDGLPATIRLPLGPAVSVESIVYIDVAGDEQTIGPDDFVLAADRIVPAPGVAWPPTRAMPGAARVRWVAGNGCPPGIKDVIRRMVRHEYDHRDAMDEKIVVAQITPWRRIAV